MRLLLLAALALAPAATRAQSARTPLDTAQVAVHAPADTSRALPSAAAASDAAEIVDTLAAPRPVSDTLAATASAPPSTAPLPRSLVLRADAGFEAQGSPRSQRGPSGREIGFAASGLAGGVIGGALLGGLGALAGASSDDDSDTYFPPSLVFGVLGAVAGYVIGVPTGVHLANGKRGSLGLGLGASAALAAGGIALIAGGTSRRDGDSGVVIPVAVIGHLLLTSLATRL